MCELAPDNREHELNQIMDQLARPFPEKLVLWKPQVLARDKRRAMAVPYAETRTYEDALNAICPSLWQTTASFQTVNGSRLACIVHLTIAGVTRAGDGESSADDENAAASAYSRAFKRACSRFGLGRHLYDLPKTWVPYDQDARRFTEQGEAELVRMYRTFFQDGGSGWQPAGPGEEPGKNGNGRQPADYRTEGQWTYILRLFSQLGLTEAQGVQEMLKKGFDPRVLSQGQASELIERLKKAIERRPVVQPAAR